MDDRKDINEAAEEAVEFEFCFGGAEREWAHKSSDAAEIVFSNEENDDSLEINTEASANAEDDEADSDAEFELPDIFDIEEKSEELRRDDVAGLWTTYVPRFTEASENYRMRTASEASPKMVISEISDSDCGVIDPIAELSHGAENVRIINVEEDKKSSDDTKTVYKFFDGSESVPEIKIRTLEDEVRELDDLMGGGTSAEAPRDKDLVADGNAKAEPSNEIKNEKPTISDSVVRESIKDKPSRVFRAEETSVELAGENKRMQRGEFSAPVQRDSFKDRFLDQMLSVRVRLIVAAVFTLALLVFENMNMLGIDIFAELRIPKYTGAPALLDLELAICVFALSIPEMVSAVINLVRGRINSEISVLLSLAVLIFYSVTVFSLKLSSYPLFGFLFAVHVIAAMYAAYIKKKTDFESFKLISSKESKSALVITPTREMPLENIALDGAVDEYKSKTVSVVRTAFVSDFFKRSGSTNEKSATSILMMGISLGAAIVCGTVSFFLYDGLASFVTAFSLVFLMAMPAFSVLTYKFVYSHAAACAKAEGIAIIGQGAISEYADADVIVLEDTEIFGEDDVKLRNFSGDMTKGMRQMSAIFSAVGGPLDKIFSSALDRKCTPATSVDVETDGICGTLDGHRIYAGTEAYMKRHGQTFESSDIRFASSGVDSTKLMYAAEDGVIYAGFRISYSFTESFTMVLPSLREEKIVPLIVTRDPNITNELMKILTMGGDAIRVFKKTNILSGASHIERRAGAGIVTLADKENALQAMLLCKKSTALSARLALTEIMALAVGAALGVALSLGGMSEAPTVALGLWQLLWCIGVGFLSWREHRGE